MVRNAFSKLSYLMTTTRNSDNETFDNDQKWCIQVNIVKCNNGKFLEINKYK